MRTLSDVHATDCCGVAATAEIIGAKWTALIVHDLSEGARRFSGSSAPAGDQSTHAVRTATHARARGLAGAKELSGVAARVEYSLTEKGSGLLSIIHEMSTFGHSWLGWARTSRQLAEAHGLARDS